MKSGVLGLINSPAEPIDGFHETTVQDGIEYEYCVEPHKTTTDQELGVTVQTGHAATDIPDETEDIEMSDGSITRVTKPVKQTLHTEWLLVPGEFLVIESGEGRFLYDILSSELGWSVNRAQLNLTSMAADYEETHLWQLGFYGNTGTAEKGVVYGDHVVDDSDIGDALGRSQVNQLGIQYEFQQNIIKASLTESGYIEVYQPSSFDSADFAAYIRNEVVDYVEGISVED